MKIRPLYLYILLGIGVIFLGIVVILIAWFWGGYNSFVTADQSVKDAWAQVETNYQRRVDLIPNIVNTVKGSANFEQSTLQAVTEARTKWMQAGAGSMNDKVAAAQGVDSALARLMVTVEAYPDLKSTESFRDLTTELEGTENRINVARRDFNDAVMAYNVKVQRFPGNVLARIYGFTEGKFFQSQPGSDKAPVVNFGQ